MHCAYLCTETLYTGALYTGASSQLDMKTTSPNNDRAQQALKASREGKGKPERALGRGDEGMNHADAMPKTPEYHSSSMYLLDKLSLA